MIRRLRNRSALAALLALTVLVSTRAHAGSGQTAGLAAPVEELEASPLTKALEAELARSMEHLKSMETPPYFLGYAVYEIQSVSLAASFGALTADGVDRARLLSVDLRAGDYRLDNTHPLRDDFMSRMRSWRQATALPLDDDIAAIRAVVWRETNSRYRKAVEDLARVETDVKVKVEEEDQSPDFSREEPVVALEPAAAPLSVDREAWRQLLKRVSSGFRSDPLILSGRASLRTQVIRRTLVTSEGTRLETSQSNAHVMLSAMTKAEDGMELPRFESFSAFRPEELPESELLVAAARSMVDDLAKLRQAPLMHPYTGPAILSGRAAGVYFHEIFGHRIEGHRQKREEEGQTFRKKVGEQVLPEFLDVVFNPTQRKLGSTPLVGHYSYDDEGVPARPVKVVEAGVLKTFLLSRSPVEGFPASNGHGRCQPGLSPVARQSNLLIKASRAVPLEELRSLLLEEVRRQEKDWGLLFADITGGFTFTGRAVPNAFTVKPVMVWRVYADGRPDELVRGADLIGTPLTSFSKIVAAGDDISVFNGTCGAESGGVPVSAASPSLLVGQIEVQRKEKSSARPPLLPSPPRPRPVGLDEEVMP